LGGNSGMGGFGTPCNTLFSLKADCLLTSSLKWRRMVWVAVWKESGGSLIGGGVTVKSHSGQYLGRRAINGWKKMLDGRCQDWPAGPCRELQSWLEAHRGYVAGLCEAYRVRWAVDRWEGQVEAAGLREGVGLGRWLPLLAWWPVWLAFPFPPVVLGMCRLG
jgi:hypothetical protein